MATIVCFGEVLIRLSAPPGEVLLQSATLEARVGGAEANVAVSLARFGHRARAVGRVPADALGRAARDELRKHGVDVEALGCGEGRMGLYFLTPGAVLRPSEVLYDRAGSAFAETDPGSYDWRSLLAGADRLHLSGVTPAVGPKPAEAAVRAVETAAELGVPVSFDGNYRAKLWTRWGGDGPGVLRRLLEGTETAFVDDRDLALVLGREFRGALEDRRADAARAAFDAFPKLRRVAATVRALEGVDDQTLSALSFTRDGETARAGPYRLTGVVDRIGGGDAFAAGVLHGVHVGLPETEALRFGLAAGVLKHSVKGDFNPVGVGDVNALLQSGGLDVRR